MDEQIKVVLERGVERVYPSREALKKRLKVGEPMSIYNGIDPTGLSLHIGHGVVLRKLRQFQDMGHKITLLIGDFTGMIGDPTDKSATRTQLARKDVLKNAELYYDQASKILKDGFEIKYNSEWLSKLTFDEIIKLSSNFTVQQMIERDMFSDRLKNGKPIYLHEFLYPLMQGYDSVAMNIDMEIGGNDQTFNMLTGRTLMKNMLGKEKFVITTKLLVDPVGKKMGKSEGNMITLSDSPYDMYGKVMSWPDERIPLGFELLTDILLNNDKIKNNPRDEKMHLAREIVAQFYGADEAGEAEKQFVDTFQNGGVPKNIQELKIDDRQNLMEVLVNNEVLSSNSEFRRLITEGAIKIEGEKISDIEYVPKIGVTVRIGRHRFYKLI